LRHKGIVFGLEDTRGFGRNLAAYLVGRKFEVKHVNPAYTSAVRLANPIIYKDDSYDAYCVARVLRDMVDTLQDAKHEDIFWTIRQMVKRRDLIVKSNVMNKNQLHSQLAYSYPSTGNSLPWLIPRVPYASGELPFTGVYMEHNTGRNISDDKACASGA